MNEVIAIEPSAFENSTEFKFMFSQFGFHQGRFIAAYPGKWISQVKKHFDGLADVEKKRLFRSLDLHGADRVLNLGLPFDGPPKTWVDNAREQKCKGNLTDVIVARNTCCEFQTPDLLDSEYFLRFSHYENVPSDAGSYANVARILLITSHEVAIVDPFLCKFRDTWRFVIEKFASTAKQGGNCKRFKIFTFEDEKREDSTEMLERQCKAFYRNVLDNVNVTHIVLRDTGRFEADDHPRYIISIKGALDFNRGFESDREREPRLRKVSAVDHSMHQLLCDQYLEENLPFEIIHKFVL